MSKTTTQSLNPKIVLTPFTKKSHVTITRYGFFIINNETASIMVSGTVEKKTASFSFAQNFVLRLAADSSASQDNSSESNNNNDNAIENSPKRFEIISDIYYDFKTTEPENKPTRSASAQKQKDQILSLILLTKIDS